MTTLFSQLLVQPNAKLPVFAHSRIQPQCWKFISGVHFQNATPQKELTASVQLVAHKPVDNVQILHAMQIILSDTST